MGGNVMRLTGDDLGRLRANPRLVSYLVESPTGSSSQSPCARLILYWSIAKTSLEMNQKVDSLRRPSSYQGPRLVDQYGYREDQVAAIIENSDLDFRGMLTAQHLISEINAISHVYARTVVGSENDTNCDLILNTLRIAGFQVPRPGICTK
jgi:hypothetical protein